MNVLTLDFKYVEQILGKSIRVAEQNTADDSLYRKLLSNFFKYLNYEATNRNTSIGKYLGKLIKRKRNKAGIEVQSLVKSKLMSLKIR